MVTSRRQFLRASGAALLTAALPDRLLRDPYAPLVPARRAADVIRVRGRVTAGGRGIGGVAVSDGVSVVSTARDGSYDLLADRAQPFVHVSVPAGYRIPVSATGTAAFHRPVGPEASFALEPLLGSDGDHAFLLLADTQTQNAFEMDRLHAETVPDVTATVRALGGRPVFGVACGDIMYDDLALFPDYERAVAAMGIPFVQVLGNHDLEQASPTDEGAAVTFGRHFGPTYYSFDRGEVHYVVLDDVFWYGTGYIGHVEQRQLAWLAADLARVERGRTVVVLLHIPVLSTRHVRNGGSVGTGESVTNREALYRLLEPYTAYAIAGHTHEHERHGDGGIRHHVTGTVCGAWWSGDICWDGTPNGYGVYEVHGSELRWRYKATGRPADLQMRVYPPGSDPRSPSDVVANVWDADESWTVVWYENGERRGLMGRRRGLDPRAVAEQTGPDAPPRRAWVEPTTTDHLYYAPVAPGSRVRVEATNRWGATYSGEA
jgi:hypothetical protein